MHIGSRIMSAIHAFSAPAPSVQAEKALRHEFKDNPVGDLIIPFFEGQEIAPPEGYEKLSTEGFKNAAVVRAVIGRVARRTAELPLKLQRRTKGEWEDLDATEDDEHPLMVLLRRPNPTQTKVDFLEACFASRKIAGETFILPNGPYGLSKPPTELWWARPDKMRCIPDTDGTVKEWKYKVGRGERTFTMKVSEGEMAPVLQWKTFNPLDQWRGLSELGSAKWQVSQTNEGAKWNAQALKNGMRPSGAFVFKPDDKLGRQLGVDQRKQLKQDIQDRVTGASNASEPLILDGGLTWQEMSISPKDLEWMEGMRDAARVICFLLGYPPIMLGIPGDATYKNYNEARMSFYQDTAIPLMNSFLEELNEWLTPMYGEDLRLAIDTDNVEALADLRAQIWDRMEKCTFLTINEKRAEVGKAKIDNPLADELWIPTSLAPIDEAGKSEEELDENGDPIEADPEGDESEDSKLPAGKKPKPKLGDKPTKPAKKHDESYRAGLTKLMGLSSRLGKLLTSSKEA